MCLCGPVTISENLECFTSWKSGQTEISYEALHTQFVDSILHPILHSLKPVYLCILSDRPKEHQCRSYMLKSTNAEFGDILEHLSPGVCELSCIAGQKWHLLYLKRNQWLLLHQKALKLQFSRSKEIRPGFKLNHGGVRLLASGLWSEGGISFISNPSSSS